MTNDYKQLVRAAVKNNDTRELTRLCRHVANDASVSEEFNNYLLTTTDLDVGEKALIMVIMSGQAIYHLFQEIKNLKH